MIYRFERFIGEHICLYRPKYVIGIQQVDLTFMGLGRQWMPQYELGPCRARVFGVRIPILWAFDCMIFAGKLKLS